MTTVSRRELLASMRAQRYAVETSVSASGSPQAAVVGVVVSDAFELFFDTLDTTRKLENLRRDPRVAFVLGGTLEGDERTVQYEGDADEPQGAELERLQRLYFERFPDGPERQAWPGLVYVRVRPRWLRYSDYRAVPPTIVELDARQLAVLT
jgi:general stress protein 26